MNSKCAEAPAKPGVDTTLNGRTIRRQQPHLISLTQTNPVPTSNQMHRAVKRKNSRAPTVRGGLSNLSRLYPKGILALIRIPRRFGVSIFVCTAFLACNVQTEAPGDITSSPVPIFQELAGEVGLDFHHFIGATGDYFIPEIIGAGVALFDYDADGDLDVYLLQGALLDKSKTLADSKFTAPTDHWPGNRLYRNEVDPEGELRFTDVTEQAGVGHEGYGMGAAVGDYDNDGDLDLYVTNFGPNVLYRNNGNGTFSDITRQAGADDPRWSTSAAFLDYDGDGDLDLFLTNYLDFSLEANRTCYDALGARDYCDPSAYRPVPDRLLRNDGIDKFTDFTHTAGVDTAFGSGLGVASADFNSDGLADIYVANDGSANQLWINRGNGRFEDVALPSGTAFNADGTAEAGMGVAVGDFDNDGDEDLFMTHLARETNTLYRNDGKANFHDVTSEHRLASASFPFTGFGVEWTDYDNDGALDLFIANGAVTVIEALRGSPYPFHQKNQMLRNDDGHGFRDLTAEAGPALDLSEVSRGAAFGDIDNDGDIDVVVGNNNGPVRLLRNEVGSRLHWLEVRLEGTTSNREGIGAIVRVLRHNKEPLFRRAHRDGSYLSANDVRVHFGLGQQPSLKGVIVEWPDASAEVWDEIRDGAVITLRQGSGQPLAAARDQPRLAP